ncbi:hypothetical protein B566_EDAN011134, partial [Ephemera danica]
MKFLTTFLFLAPLILLATSQNGTSESLVNITASTVAVNQSLTIVGGKVKTNATKLQEEIRAYQIQNKMLQEKKRFEAEKRASDARAEQEKKWREKIERDNKLKMENEMRRKLQIENRRKQQEKAELERIENQKRRLEKADRDSTTRMEVLKKKMEEEINKKADIEEQKQNLAERENKLKSS